MELGDGTLTGRLQECQKAGLSGIPVQELLGYFREAAEALDYLHSQHVQHRDVKPENILLSQRHAKVADFGLARLQQTMHLAAATFSGTPAFMAPEVWSGMISPNSDQYSLGMTYIALRLARRPFPGTSLQEVMNAHLHGTPDLAPLSPAEQQVILRAVSKKPEERFPTCCGFVRSLEDALGGEIADERALSRDPHVDPFATLLPGQTSSNHETLTRGAPSRTIEAK